MKTKTFLLLATTIMLLSLALSPHFAQAGGACFSGASKGYTKDASGQWHHYVQFNVDRNNAGWTVSGPLWPSVWGYSANKTLRAGYKWPHNWWDPFPPSAWRVCRN